jgi:hypothetical protein
MTISLPLRRTLLAPTLLALALAAAPPPAAAQQQQPADRASAGERPAAGAATRSKARRATGTRKAGAAKRAAAKAGTTNKSAAGATAAARPAPVWPVKGPAPLPGSVLPAKRIVAYYGNPLSKRMGILGEVAPDQMLERLDKEVARWSAADPSTPAQPALHLIVVVAQASPGRDGKYRLRMTDSLIERVYGWAQRKNALLFLDVQVAKSTLREELPRLATFLQRPNVHLGIDPEFSMKGGQKPGTVIGTMDAADVNYASDYLAGLVTAHKLPPKVLVVHRFTRNMLTRTNKIALDPRVQVVINMDGWGGPHLKRQSYDAYVYRYPVQYTGFKLFYKNDTKKGHPLMKPADVLALDPKPVYIQYQ